jgi:hypothetical protein
VRILDFIVKYDLVVLYIAIVTTLILILTLGGR